MISDEITAKIIERMNELRKGPQYDEAKRIAEKMLRVMAENENGTIVSNGQLILIGAMVSAVLMKNAPNGPTQETAILMHMSFLQSILEKIKEDEKQAASVLN